MKSRIRVVTASYTQLKAGLRGSSAGDTVTSTQCQTPRMSQLTKRPRMITVFSAVTALSTTLLVAGVFVAYFQLRAVRKDTKAQVLIKLSEEWRSQAVYEAATYVNRLRTEWRTSAIKEWPHLAEKWVYSHAGRDPHSAQPEERRLWDEWFMRRTASQFLAKMGSLMRHGYINPNDLFGVVPEAGRLLLVLTPIEIAIAEYWSRKEGTPVAAWDHAMGKWEFKELWQAYQDWWRPSGEKYDLNWKDWNSMLEQGPIQTTNPPDS
jgi:hypothetical protein